MDINLFDYQLPESLIARYPLQERAKSRLLVLDRHSAAIQHRQFADLIGYLMPNDLLVFNNSKVMPARLYGTKPTGGKVEVLIERVLNDKQVMAQVGASKTPKPGGSIILDDGSELLVESREDQWFFLKLQSDKTIWQVMDDIGHMPLPHYMNREDEQSDQQRYQTVYAKHLGSVAAPTAGLHFDEALLAKIADKGIDTAYVTLHVGAGTYQPVRANDIREHTMHAEWITVSEETCQKIRACKARGGRVIAVGTTSVRSLETASQAGQIQAYNGETRIFIYPGYQFKTVDALITNFHLPKSSLLMLVSALAGVESIRAAYQTAISERYRFYSYGDAMFIL